MRLGHLLILSGFLLAFIALLLIPILAMISGEASLSFGGCIVILFFPICFGVGDKPLLLILAAMLLAIALMILSYFILRPQRGAAE
ncbi:MAG: hypothetical protein LM591_07510 [Candidatus Korarchaeum sp.]|jgi:uncharacterized membrane protein|nr:hypothetical protein [Candidatus Korarchaeum sp.]